MNLHQIYLDEFIDPECIEIGQEIDYDMLEDYEVSFFRPGEYLLVNNVLETQMIVAAIMDWHLRQDKVHDVIENLTESDINDIKAFGYGSDEYNHLYGDAFYFDDKTRQSEELTEKLTLPDFAQRIRRHKKLIPQIYNITNNEAHQKS